MQNKELQSRKRELKDITKSSIESQADKRKNVSKNNSKRHLNKEAEPSQDRVPEDLPAQELLLQQEQEFVVELINVVKTKEQVAFVTNWIE